MDGHKIYFYLERHMFSTVNVITGVENSNRQKMIFFPKSENRGYMYFPKLIGNCRGTLHNLSDANRIFDLSALNKQL